MQQNSPYKGKHGIKRIFNATRYSLDGFKSAFHLEAAFRQIIFINVVLLVINLFLDISLLEHLLLVVVGVIAIIVELINSAIEAVVDRISLEQHELSKNAKDMGSAAQMAALFLIAFTWVAILFF